MATEIDSPTKSIATLVADKPLLALDILQGASLGSTKLDEDEMLSVFGGDWALNKKFNQAMMALRHTGKYGDSIEEIARTALNIHTVFDSLFSDGSAVVLPKDISPGEFEMAGKHILRHNDRIERYANGRPAGVTAEGKPVEFDDEEFKWETVEPGKYSLRHRSGQVVMNDKGKRLIIDMRKVLQEEDVEIGDAEKVFGDVEGFAPEF